MPHADSMLTYGFSHVENFYAPLSPFSFLHSVILLNILSITFLNVSIRSFSNVSSRMPLFTASVTDSKQTSNIHETPAESRSSLWLGSWVRDNNKNRTTNVSLLMPGSIVAQALRRVLSNYLLRCASRITNR